MLHFVVLLLTSLLLLPMTVTPALAKVSSSAAQVHVVKSGDSLYEIAQQHGITVNELKRLNGLSSNRLKLGQKLALNRAAAPPLRRPAKTAKAAGGNAVASSQGSGQALHTVRKGDSLHTIARSHGITVEQLKQLNHLKNNKLQIGQQLALGTAPGGGEALAAAPVQSRQTGSRVGRDAHVVKKGDTLATIARRHHVSVKELKRLNGLRSNNLKIGQRLALNDPYEERNPILLPGDANEEEILSMAYSSRSELEQVAFNFLSTPYRFGGTSRRGIDCSSFVQQVFRGVDVSLPRSAREQFRVGSKVERDELQPGDLVFFRTYARFPSHVGIYLGDNKMIHASSRSRRVVVTSLDYPYYQKRFIGAKRITLLEKELQTESGEETSAIGQLASATLTPEPAAATEQVTLLARDAPHAVVAEIIEEGEELGDAVSEEEAAELLVPRTEKFEPASEPLKPLTIIPLTTIETSPTQQTASAAPIVAAPIN